MENKENILAAIKAAVTALGEAVELLALASEDKGSNEEPTITPISLICDWERRNLDLANCRVQELPNGEYVVSANMSFSGREYYLFLNDEKMIDSRSNVCETSKASLNEAKRLWYLIRNAIA